MFKIFVIALSFIQIHCQATSSYGVEQFIDPFTNQIDLFSVSMRIYEKVFYPLFSNPSTIRNVTAESINKEIENCMTGIHPNVTLTWKSLLSQLKERAQKLPTLKLTQFANNIIQEAENGTIFYYIVKDKLLLWSIREINKVGYEALYRLWFYEHNISADIYGIIENHFNISSFDDTIRNYMNIDKENYLYKSEEL